MRNWIVIALMLGGATAASRAAVGGGGEERVIVVIRADGSAGATNATVQPRALAEQRLRWWLRARQDLNDAEEDADAPPKPVETKPLTDAELKAAIQEGTRLTAEQTGLERRLELLEVTSNEVRTVWSQQYSNLAQFAGHAPAVIAQAGFHPENLRLESTNGQLRITLVASPQMKRYVKAMRMQWKATRARAELIWILPGKVVSSDLPSVDGNRTAIRVSSDDEQSIEAYLKASEENVVITAELNGLALAQPVESKTFRRAGGDEEMTGDQLPITDAGPGFIAEALSVTTSTLTLFPEGAQFLKPSAAMGFETGTVVRAKLFPPKGRSILSASEVRVTRAVDDQGRAIGTAEDSEAQGRRNFRSFSSGDGDEKSPGVDLELKLGLPAPDAGAIAELNGQAVVVTVGGWKEFTVRNLPANATNTFDLGTICPGAKLTLKKVTARRQQVTIDAQLTGPPAVRALELQCRQPGSDSAHTFTNDRGLTSAAAQTTRTVQLRFSSYEEESVKLETLVLLVRAPDDLRREKVPIKLENLDLL